MTESGEAWLHVCKACLFLVGNLTISGPGSDLDASDFSDYRRKRSLQAGRCWKVKGNIIKQRNLTG